jgi:hypothetical protein
LALSTATPWLRLLRHEVEELMDSAYDDRDHQQRRSRAEVAGADRDLKKLRDEDVRLTKQI